MLNSLFYSCQKNSTWRIAVQISYPESYPVKKNRLVIPCQDILFFLCLCLPCAICLSVSLWLLSNFSLLCIHSLLAVLHLVSSAAGMWKNLCCHRMFTLINDWMKPNLEQTSHISKTHLQYNFLNFIYIFIKPNFVMNHSEALKAGFSLITLKVTAVLKWIFASNLKKCEWVEILQFFSIKM